MKQHDPDCPSCHGSGTYEAYSVDRNEVGHDVEYECDCKAPVDAPDSTSATEGVPTPASAGAAVVCAAVLA